MHARVAAFENRDMSRSDELVQLVRDRAALPVYAQALVETLCRHYSDAQAETA